MLSKSKKVVSMIISIALILQFVIPLLSVTVNAQTTDKYFYLTPELSDGLTIDQDDAKNLFVKGNYNNGNFTFSESKELTFKVTVAEGWTYSSDYSVFFSDDKTNVQITTENSVMTFKYSALKGKAIPFSDLETICLNTTPDKLPTLNITIDGDFSSVGKEDWVTAQFKLEKGTKTYKTGNTYTGTGSVKGRGNYSWTQPQKPYSIKLDAKTSLLDIPKTKKYAIVSTYLDSSLIRNYLTYKTGLNFDGLQYTPKIEFVDVYLNGTYNGIYALVERIDIESTKVDIDKATAENVTGGYIIEKDAGDKVDKTKDPWFECPFQANTNEDLFTVKAPDPPTTEMLEYLKNYMIDVDNAIMGKSDKSYKDYVDMDSWADFLIMQELAKNIDGNLKTSCYFVKEKDTNILRMDALWDFDIAYGTANWNNASDNNNKIDCPNGTGTSDFMVINSSCPWFNKLYTEDDFNTLVKSRYTEYRKDVIPSMQRLINTEAAYLSKASTVNYQKWHTGNFSTSISTLKNWLNGRISWLDTKWKSADTKQYNVAVSIPENGSVTGNTTIDYGATSLYTITPDLGYKVASATYNNIDVTSLINNNTIETPIITKNGLLNVTFEKVDYNVTVDTLTNGTVTPDKTTAQIGDTVNLTVTPNTGYKLKENSLKVNGVAITETQFTMTSENAVISAEFEKVDYNITVDTLTNGTVTPDKTTAQIGDTVNLTVTPNTGYKLKENSLKVNGVAITETQFTMTSENAVISAEFEKVDYNVTVDTLTNGTVTPDKTTAQIGDTVNLTITPNTGYKLKENSLKVNGVAITETQFTMTSENAVISAEFEKVDYNVTVDTLTNGTVTPDKTTAQIGDTVNLTITPNTGYKLKENSLKVNGVAITETQFTMTSENAVISAEFEKVSIPTEPTNPDNTGNPSTTANTNKFGYVFSIFISILSLSVLTLKKKVSK